MVHKPSWFRDKSVFVSFAPTVGINKDGDDLFVIDAASAARTEDIDNKVAEDVHALVENQKTTPTSRWVELNDFTDRLIAVPIYYDDRPDRAFDDLMGSLDGSDFTSATLGELIDDGRLIAKQGHGSPSADMRTGTVPYIKVSDIRAGQVNINPTNRVTEVVAEKFWKGKTSGLTAFDLISPIRTSKNIGDFAVLMPGQERVVLTKEMLVLHAAAGTGFDNFYLLWAMSLKAVRRQWDRIVFMQTNREDVGARYREIRIPVPTSSEIAMHQSKPFRDYYLGIEKLRQEFLDYLGSDNRHHIFMSSVEAVEEAAELDISDSDLAPSARQIP